MDRTDPEKLVWQEQSSRLRTNDFTALTNIEKLAQGIDVENSDRIVFLNPPE